jgi:hypothetical protein
VRDYLPVRHGRRGPRRADRGDGQDPWSDVVVGRGTIDGHKLRITFKHLHPGQYRITMRDLKEHGKSVVLERTTLTVS